MDRTDSHRHPIHCQGVDLFCAPIRPAYPALFCMPIATVSESEGFVYLRQDGAVGFDGFESLEDLRNNWNRLLDVAGLEPDERREAVQLFHAKVEKVKGTEL